MFLRWLIGLSCGNRMNYDHTAGWIKISLSLGYDLGQGHIVLGGKNWEFYAVFPFFASKGRAETTASNIDFIL